MDPMVSAAATAVATATAHGHGRVCPVGREQQIDGR